MRRVLLPYDGSAMADAMIPDALRVAGTNGVLILFDNGADMAASVRLDLESSALEAGGVTVETHTLAVPDLALAIDEAAEHVAADMIVLPTHGRRPIERLVRGGVAWRAMAHSRVPVLLRHIDSGSEQPEVPKFRSILVPLDGSAYAERALRLASDLAEEWHAGIVLVRVIHHLETSETLYDNLAFPESMHVEEADTALVYLESIAAGLTCPVRILNPMGRTADRLVDCVETLKITDVVMASHGRTGLSRAVLGSVADELIRQLRIPVIVVPALAELPAEEPVRNREHAISGLV